MFDWCYYCGHLSHLLVARARLTIAPLHGRPVRPAVRYWRPLPSSTQTFTARRRTRQPAPHTGFGRRAAQGVPTLPARSTQFLHTAGRMFGPPVSCFPGQPAGQGGETGPVGSAGAGRHAALPGHRSGHHAGGGAIPGTGGH